MHKQTSLIHIGRVQKHVYMLHSEKVILSPHPAELYGVPVSALIQALKRNRDRFPADFIFQLDQAEDKNLKSQTVISSWDGARRALACAFTVLLAALLSASGAEIEWQPLNAQVQRVIEAMELIGSPLNDSAKAGLQKIQRESDPSRAVEQMEKLLEPLCLVEVDINPESRVKVSRGAAAAQLVEGGWSAFLVKVHNEAGVTARLQAQSPNARPLAGSPGAEVADRWLDLAMFDQQPLQPALSGLELEYRIIELYSRDAGRREAKIAFNVGQGTQDLGFRSEISILFDCRAAWPVQLDVQDEDGRPATGCFLIKDKMGRVYPSMSKRLAPDFPFHPQIYRGDGEVLKLPDGECDIEFSRGPESVVQKRSVLLKGKAQRISFKVKRWIDPVKLGWWSGDHHIHAAGCAHYEKPTEGVGPADMLRQCQGEDLKVGCNLTWGPCFDFQKRFFSGAVDKTSQYPYLLRYDVEVSGFGSHRSGHLCLLRLKEQIYPGGDSDKHWPTLCLNTLRWAKKQGAVCGCAHSGWGLKVETNALPSYIVPPFDGIGANEYIVDVTHEVPGPDGKLVPAVDFLSLVDTPYIWELNIWYHTMNAGFRTKVSGETDFPCIYGERVGMGRSYVKLDGKLDFDAWCEGIRSGRSYASNGRSHLLEFKVNDEAVGEKGSELRLNEPGHVRVTAKVAALLGEEPNRALGALAYDQKPFWNLERARIGARTPARDPSEFLSAATSEGSTTRKSSDDIARSGLAADRNVRAPGRDVPLEVVVNGLPVVRTNFTADGVLRDVAFDVAIARSSWIALRILPSSHTNPIWVQVAGKPLAPSRRSLEWCLKGVDQCWSQKKSFISASEMEDAKLAYDHARQVYREQLKNAQDW